jgi:transmembrane sensor
MRSPDNETDSEAWHWALLEFDGPLSSEQSRALQSWLNDDPRREGALARARAACLYLARASVPGRGNPEAASGGSGRSTRRRFITSSLAAGAVIGLGTWIGRAWIEEHGREVSYSSEVGQIRRVLLADGLELMLNTATEVIVRYAGPRREAFLARGEALFTVAHSAVPFFVVIGEWLVQATDTTFAVRLSPRDQVFADILVTKGIVDMFASESHAQRKPLRLAENQEAIVGIAGSLELRTETDQEEERRLAWRSGMVVFEGEPLHAAIAEMNRYSRRQLALSDPELAERRIAGVFRVGDIETFVSQLQYSWGVEPVSRDGVVLLRAKSNSH